MGSLADAFKETPAEVELREIREMLIYRLDLPVDFDRHRLDDVLAELGWEATVPR
jgi:hypothetical protein